MISKLDFWEKILGHLTYNGLTYDLSPEKRKEILNKNFKIKNALYELIHVSRNINNTISEYISAKIDKKIELDQMTINALNKLIKKLKRKRQFKNKDDVIIAYNILKMNIGKEIDTLLKKHEDKIIDYCAKKTDQFRRKIDLLMKYEGKESILEGVVVKSDEAELSLRGKFKQNLDKEKVDELVNFYMQYITTNDVFKIIQTDNLLINEPLKALLTENKSFVEKSDLLKLRIKEPLMESSSITRSKDVKINNISDYLFLKTHHWIKLFIPPVKYKKVITKDEAKFFKANLDFGIEVYNSLLKKIVELISYEK